MFGLPQISPGPFVAITAIALALAMPHTAAFAASELDTLEKGPTVGASIPHPLAARDQTNKVRDFSSLTGKNGLIVLF